MTILYPYILIIIVSIILNIFLNNYNNNNNNKRNDNFISNNDLKGKVLIQDDDSRNLINIKKSSNYEEMEGIDDYCSNFYIKGQKNLEKEDLKKNDNYNNNEGKEENENINNDVLKIDPPGNDEFSDCINIINIGKFNKIKNNNISNDDNNFDNTDSNLLTVNKDDFINRSAPGISQDNNNINNNNDNDNNYLSLNRQTSNINSSFYSSTVINENNSKYSSVTTVNRNNSVNCHNSDSIENMLRNHHDDTNSNQSNNILGSEFVSHEDLLDNFDNGTSSSNQDNCVSLSCDSSINKKFDELLNSNNELNNDDNLLLNQINESNDVCLDINNDDTSSCCSSNGNISEFVNMESYFFNNKDIMHDSNITDYGYNPMHYDMWDVKENDNNKVNTNYSNYNDNKYNNNNSVDYYNGDSSYKSSYSDTFTTKNKYKGYQEFKSTANTSSYFLNKDEKVKTDSQIMLFPEIAKQMSNEKIKVYNSKPFSISSNNSTDDCSSILNYTPSKHTSYYQKDNGDMYESSMSRLNSKTFNNSTTFNDNNNNNNNDNNNDNNNNNNNNNNNSTSVLQITRSNSVIVNNGKLNEYIINNLLYLI